MKLLYKDLRGGTGFDSLMLGTFSETKAYVIKHSMRKPRFKQGIIKNLSRSRHFVFVNKYISEFICYKSLKAQSMILFRCQNCNMGYPEILGIVLND